MIRKNIEKNVGNEVVAEINRRVRVVKLIEIQEPGTVNMWQKGYNVRNKAAMARVQELDSNVKHTIAFGKVLDTTPEQFRAAREGQNEARVRHEIAQQANYDKAVVAANSIIGSLDKLVGWKAGQVGAKQNKWGDATVTLSPSDADVIAGLLVELRVRRVQDKS